MLNIWENYIGTDWTNIHWNIKILNLLIIPTSCCSGGCALLGAHKMVFFGVRAAPPPLCSKNSCENSDSLSLSSRVASPGFPSSVFSRRRQIYNGYLFHEVDYMHINAGCCQAAAAGEGGRRADDGERWRGKPFRRLRAPAAPGGKARSAEHNGKRREPHTKCSKLTSLFSVYIFVCVILEYFKTLSVET